MRGRWIALCVLLAAWPALAADPVPEIVRPPATPQAPGVLHTLRQIPEACARIQGRFTGNPADPYAFELVKTSPNCAPRARLVDAAKARAYLGERDFVGPADFQALAPPVLGHRLCLRGPALDSRQRKELVREAVELVPVPR